MIAEFRQNRDLLQLDCKVTIIGAKNTKEAITANLEFNGLKGRLSTPFWDHVIGTNRWNSYGRCFNRC
jgi:hypothetical protein